jgi:F0F1-type ATP synthase assembly protein I
MPMPSKEGLASAGRYAAFGMEFAAIVVGAVLAGYYLDEFLGTSPLMILLLTVGGMIGAVRRLLWSLKKHS